MSKVLGILPVGDVKGRISDQLPNIWLVRKFLTGAQISFLRISRLSLILAHAKFLRVPTFNCNKCYKSLSDFLILESFVIFGRHNSPPLAFSCVHGLL
jgi:hypothetical protein